MIISAGNHLRVPEGHTRGNISINTLNKPEGKKLPLETNGSEHFKSF